MAVMNQLKPLASLSLAALVALFSSSLGAASAVPKCGFTRALRIIESVEGVKGHSTSHANVRRFGIASSPAMTLGA